MRFSSPDSISLFDHLVSKPGFAEEFAFAEEHVGPMESELERVFLARWVELTLGCGSTAYGGAHLRKPSFTQLSPWFHLNAQQSLPEGFRADFQLHLKTANGAFVSTAVIECDGHAFHGSPEAFECDRKRDLVCAAYGLPTFRYTWTVLTRSPDPLRPIIKWSRRLRAVRGKVA